MRTPSRDVIKNFSKYYVFTYSDVETYLKSRHSSIKNLARRLSYLKKVHKIYSVTKGVYSQRNDKVVAGFAFRPFYYGLTSALTIRDLWTQNSRFHVVTARPVRHSELVVFGDKNDRVFLHHIPMRYYFGFETMEYAGLKVPVSDPEKTLIDLFYFRTRLAIQNYSELLKIVEQKKVKKYLEAYDGHTKKIVINFISRYKGLADRGKLDNPY